jgi:hypothetical protein
LPSGWWRRIRQRARDQRVPKSRVVRDAIEAYLGASPPPDPAELWARVAPLVGSVSLDRAAAERDALARQIRAHNWRS